MSAPRKEKIWDIPICEATASRLNTQALKNGAFGQRGFVDEVELKLPKCCGFNQEYLGLRVFEQVLSRLVEELERESNVI